MTAATTITVRVVVPVRIDLDAWVDTYGTGTDRAVVRDDVRNYVENLVLEQLREVGVLAEPRA